MVERHAEQMRADDCNRKFLRHAVPPARCGSGACLMPAPPSAQFGLRMHDAADAGERGIFAAAGEEGHAIGRAIGTERDRHGKTAEIEQVHEIRVGAEIAVEPDWIGFELPRRYRPAGAVGTISASSARHHRPDRRVSTRSSR